MFVDHVRFTRISALASEATNIIHGRAFYRGAGCTSAVRAVSKKLRRMRDPAPGFFRMDLARVTKKSGALSRPTLFALPKNQVLAVAAPAPTVAASTTIVVSTIKATMSVVATRAMIETVIVVSKVMVTATPAMPVGTEMMVVMAVKAKRRIVHAEGRIETPAERAVEDSISRNVGVTAVIRIPIPTGAVPAAHRIGLSPIDVSFRGIRRPQAAPAIEIVLGLFFVEFLGFRRTAVSERDLMIALDLDIPVHLPNGRLALVHADEVVICVKVVKAGLEQTHSVAV